MNKKIIWAIVVASLIIFIGAIVYDNHRKEEERKRTVWELGCTMQGGWPVGDVCYDRDGGVIPW